LRPVLADGLPLAPRLWLPGSSAAVQRFEIDVQESWTGVGPGGPHYPAPVLRRILWFVAGLLALAVIAAAVIPRDDAADKTTPTTSAPERTRVKADIGASPVRARTIRARVGDHLELTVESDRIDQVEIPGLDQIRPVDPTTPAQFDTLLDHSGRFEVRMQQGRQVVAIVDVKQS
jgi:hypothetical protein